MNFITKLFNPNGWTAAQRKAYKELTHLDDKQLRDIGLTRGEIFDVVDNWRDRDV
jgi:uncharacterized protein YjiS (DUF1127 family)